MSVHLLNKYLSDVVPEDGAFVLTETSRNTKKTGESLWSEFLRDYCQ